MPDEQPRPFAPDTPKEVDRLRDMIFGGQMREYAQRFQTLQRDLERLQNELDRISEEMADQTREYEKKLQTLRRDARQSDDDLRTELRETTDKLQDDKVDRLALGELFIEVGNQLKAGGSISHVLRNLADLG